MNMILRLVILLSLCSLAEFRKRRKSKGRKTDLNTMAGDFLVRPVLEVFKLVINCADFLGIKVSYLT